MHIVDGALSNEVVISGIALATVGIAVGLKKMDYDQLAQTGVLSAAFFVASLIHLPVGVTSVHLILNGLLGLLLGWAAFPALFIALLLQMVFFGFGGFLVLGINTFNIAFPALLMFLLFRRFIHAQNQWPNWKITLIGALLGGGAIALTALLVSLSLALSGEAFIESAKLALVSHVPVMLLEGLVTAAVLRLLLLVKPHWVMGEAQ